MKNINFTSVGIVILIVLNLGIGALLVIDRRNHHRSQECMRPGAEREHAFHQRMKHHQENPEMHHNMHGNHHNLHKKHSFDHRSPFAELQLSKEQQSKLDTLKKTHKAKREVLDEKLEALKKKERALLQSGKMDDAQMNLLAQEFGTYQKELHLLKLSHRKALFQVLTPEQREKMKQHNMQKTSRDDGASQH